MLMLSVSCATQWTVSSHVNEMMWRVVVCALKKKQNRHAVMVLALELFTHVFAPCGLLLFYFSAHSCVTQCRGETIDSVTCSNASRQLQLCTVLM